MEQEVVREKRVQFACPLNGVAAEPVRYHSLEEDRLKKRTTLKKRAYCRNINTKPVEKK